MAIPILSDILTAASNTVNKIIDKISGDKMNEGDKLKLQTEIAIAMAEIDLTKFNREIDDQIDARALAKVEAEKAPYFIRLFNGIVRPFGGIGALIIFFYTVVYKHVGQFFKIELKELALVDWQWIILLSIIAFFFGLRQIGKLNGTVNKF